MISRPLRYALTVVLTLYGLAQSAEAQYCPPSSPQSDGMRDIMLIYGEPGKWKKEDFLPYVAYLDPTGKPRDWFYDAYLFMMFGGAPSGTTYIDGPSNKSDWEYFIAEEFAPDREFAALDATIDEVAKELRTPAPAVPVIVMIPYPCKKQKNFGDVDGDGRPEDFSGAGAPREKAVAWFLREFTARWQKTPRRHLKLWGFYWMNEGIGEQDEAVVKAAAKEIHSLGYKFHWIPWFNAPGVEKWRELGFDLVVMQPNYAFIRSGGPAIHDENRLTLAANQCRRLGMGIEMELNEGLIGDPAYRINLQLYMDHGDDALDGYQAGAVRAYYQGYNTIAQLCRSDSPALRRLYDDLYAFHKGTYKRRRPYQPLPPPAAMQTQAACLVDGLWNTKPGASAPVLSLAGPKATLLFDFGGARLAGDVRVHFPPSAVDPAAALQRAGLALSVSATGDAFEEVASIDDVSVPPEHGGFAILSFAPRLARRMRLDFEIKQGERVAVDEVLLMPTGHLLWGASCEVSPGAEGDAGCLTDGIMGGEAMALWPKGKGQVRFSLKEAWYAKSLLVHFRQVGPDASAPKAAVEVSAGGSAPERRDGVCQAAGAEGTAIILLNRPVQQIALSVESAGGPVAVDEIMLLPEENLARGCGYTLDPPFKAKYPDPDGRKLTDGQITTRGFGDGKTVGWASWHGAPAVTVVVDTDESRPIDAVEAHVEGGTYGAVHFPERVAVSVSEDGRRWTKVVESAGNPQETVALAMDGTQCLLGWLKLPGKGARGRYVRMRFAVDTWLMISEVRVISHGQNVALGRPYSLMPQPTSDEQYADNSGRLTDGQYSRSGSGWRECVGYAKTDPTITVDLGATQTISVARMHLTGGGPGAVFFPAEATVATATDGKTWTPAGVTRDHPPETGHAPATGFMGVTFEPREARFVRFHLKRHGWVMPDEIEVFPASGESR